MSYAPSTRPVNRPTELQRLSRAIRPARPAHGLCSLVLSIRGVRYRVKPVACQCDALKCYELTKCDGGDRYHVSRHSWGLQCTCPDHTFKREGLTVDPCKHGAALLALGMLDAPAPAPDDFPALRGGTRRGPQPRRDDGPPTVQYPSPDTDGPGLNTCRGGHDA